MSNRFDAIRAAVKAAKKRQNAYGTLDQMIEDAIEVYESTKASDEPALIPWGNANPNNEQPEPEERGAENGTGTHEMIAERMEHPVLSINDNIQQKDRHIIETHEQPDDNSKAAIDALEWLAKNIGSIVLRDSTSASGFSNFHYVHFQSLMAHLTSLKAPERESGFPINSDSLQRHQDILEMGIAHAQQWQPI